MATTKTCWERTALGNYITRGDGFMVSYRADTGSLVPMFRGDDDEETAIVADGRYFILNGDFRAEYESLIPQGLAACVEFFKSKPELHSGWSNQP